MNLYFFVRKRMDRFFFIRKIYVSLQFKRKSHKSLFYIQKSYKLLLLLRIGYKSLFFHTKKTKIFFSIQKNPTCLPHFLSIPGLYLVLGGKNHHFFTTPAPPHHTLHHSISTGLIWLIDFEVVFKSFTMPTYFKVVRRISCTNAVWQCTYI